VLEGKGDLWDFQVDARVVTTNGFVKKNGACVMGRGCALEATRRYMGVEFTLGGLIKKSGNQVYQLTFDKPHLVSFPVKHNWWEKADVKLIEKSTKELVALTERSGWKNVVLPRPGCGNGQLNWEDVKGVLSSVLDDRFMCVTF